MSEERVRRTGIKIGKLSITWWDLWANRRCFEIAVGRWVLVDIPKED